MQPDCSDCFPITLSLHQACCHIQAPHAKKALYLLVLTLQVITRVASTRVAEYAFKYADENKRNKVTAVHKANIMKMADGLFIKCCREGEFNNTSVLDQLQQWRNM